MTKEQEYKNCLLKIKEALKKEWPRPEWMEFEKEVNFPEEL